MKMAYKRNYSLLGALVLAVALIGTPALAQKSPMPAPKVQFFDNNGDPLAGGKVCTYITGTGTPLATWTDYTGGASNTNPVTLDSAGRANIWLGSGTYRITLQDSTGTAGVCNGVQIWSADGVTALPPVVTFTTITADTIIAGKVNNILFVDGVKYATPQVAHDNGPASNFKIIIPAGSWGTLNITKAGVQVEGVGDATILTAAAATTPIVTMNAARSAIRNLRIEGQATSGATIQVGIELQIGGATVENVTLSGADASHGLNNAIQADNGVDGNIIRNNRIERMFGTASGVGYGILLINSDSNIISDNHITFTSTNGRHHIYVSQGSQHNIIDGNDCEGGTNSAIPLYATDAQTTNQYNIVSNNRIRNLTATVGGGIEIANRANYNLVSGNLIETTSANHGILLWDGGSAVTNVPTSNHVTGNLIFNAGLSGIAVSGGDANLIEGNYVIGSNQAASGNAGIAISPGSTTAAANRILNNFSSGTAATYALQLYASGTNARVYGNTLVAGATGTLLDSATGTKFGLNDENGTSTLGTIGNYNRIATVAGGVPAEYAERNLTAQTAAITTTTLYGVPASGAGQYRVSWNAKVTTPATTGAGSSTLGALTIVYTDPDGVVQTITAPASVAAGTIATTSTGNSTTTVLLGMPLLLNCKLSTNITYAMAYVSDTAAQMQFNLHIILEKQ